MKKLILILPLLIVFNKINAQVTLENLLSAPFPTELKSSPNGRMLAWVFNDKGSRNVYIAESPEFTPHKLTNNSGDNGVDITNLSFTPDSRSVIFTEGNSLNGDGEPANPAQLQKSTARAVWIVNTNGTGLRKLAAGGNFKTDHTGNTAVYTTGGKAWRILLSDSIPKPELLFAARGILIDLRWSPDDKQLAFISNRGDHAFLGICDVANKTIQYPDPSVDIDSQPVWSPDGQWIAYVRTPNAKNILPFMALRSGSPWSIRLLDLQHQKAKELWKADEGPGSILYPVFPSAENILLWGKDNHLVFPWEKDGWQHLYALDVFKGSKPRLLTPGAGEVEQMVLSQDKSSVIYTTNIGDIHRRHIYSVGLMGGQPVQLSSGNNIECSVALLSSGYGILQSGATSPMWPAVIGPDGAIHKIAMSEFPASFPQKELVIPTIATFKAKDDIISHGELFLPPHYQHGKRYPALIFLHGGPQRQMLLGFHYFDYYSDSYAMNQYLASRGYIVIAINYRTGTGYGLNFREALNYGPTGASEYQDVLATAMFLRARADVDSKRIGLWGGSYGGFLTATGLARNSDIFACGVDMHGVHNWNEEIKYWVPAYDSTANATFAKLAYQSSPLYYLHGWRSPVLLIHGDDDRNVPFGETVELAEKLKKLNVHFEQLIIPDEIHYFLLHKTWLTSYQAAADFFDRMLQNGN